MIFTLSIFNGQVEWLLEVIILVLIGLIVLLFHRQISKGIWHLVLARFRHKDRPTYLAMRQPLIRPLGLLLAAIFFNTALHQVEAIPDPYWLLICVVSAFGIALVKESDEQKPRISPSAVSLLASTVRVVVIVVAIFVILSFWVDNLSGIIAGVGIGGLAIALAAQDTLANAFASLMILFDQPFEVGDWIETPDVTGSVISIGLRSTRIRPIDQSIVTIPNSKLAANVISNGTLREKRRVDLNMTLSWTLSFEQMENFRQGVLHILAEHEAIEVDTYEVNFAELASDGARLSLYFYGPADYSGVLKTQNDVNMSILELAEKYQIIFHSPTLYRNIDEPKDSPMS